MPVGATGPCVLVLNSRDNVAVAIQRLREDEEVDLGGRRLRIAEEIPFGHKVALAEIAVGAEVVKYGEVIGRATAAIRAGRHVHVHNVVSARLPGGAQ